MHNVSTFFARAIARELHLSPAQWAEYLQAGCLLHTSVVAQSDRPAPEGGVCWGEAQIQGIMAGLGARQLHDPGISYGCIQGGGDFDMIQIFAIPTGATEGELLIRAAITFSDDGFGTACRIRHSLRAPFNDSTSENDDAYYSLLAAATDAGICPD